MISNQVVTFGDNLNFSCDRIDQALTKIGTTSKAAMVLRYGTWSLDESQTITSNVYFSIPPGAVLTGAYTLTIQGEFTGSDGCFGSTLTVVFDVGSVDVVLPKWFGETYASLTRTRASIALSGIPMDLGTIANDPTTTAWGTAETGTRWFNTDAGVWKWWNGTAVVEMTGGTGATDHGTLTGLTDDDHTIYRLESADHTHQSTGLQGGQLDHGLALTGLTDDDHTIYLKKASNLSEITVAATAASNIGLGTTDSPTFAASKASSTAPRVWLNKSDANANHGKWRFDAYSEGIFRLQAINDAEDSSYSVFDVTRDTTNGIALVEIPSATEFRVDYLGSFADLKVKGPWVDPRHPTYGAHWNGTDDDTAHIQAAIDANVGKTIFLPPGTPLISSALVCTAATATRIVGCGEAVTNLYSVTNQHMIEFDTTAGDIYYAGVSDLTIANNCSGTRTNATAIAITGANDFYRSQFRNIHSRGCYYGVEVHSTVSSTQWCEFAHWLLDNYSTYNHYVGFLWNAPCGICEFHGIRSIVTTGGSGMAFMVGFGDGTISAVNHYGGTNGIFIQKGTGSYSAYFTISGCKMDGCTHEIYITDCDHFRCIGNAPCGTDAVIVTLGGTNTNYLIDSWNAGGFDTDLV